VHFTLQVKAAGAWHTVGSFPGTLGLRSSATVRLVYRSRAIEGVRTRIHARFLGDADHLGSETPWQHLDITG
jgi:hypothetical protein